MTATRLNLPPLDPAAVPLQGIQLVEAGAGTGKTWTIAALVLRLILEAELTIGQILVVTYTNSACGELRGRIRARLAEALAAFESGNTEDAFLATLCASVGNTESAKGRLHLALECFDEAAIYTIHGFCQRALAETAFEAGRAFEREIVADQSALIEAAARDAWRREMGAATHLWASWLLHELGTPEKLAERIKAYLGRTLMVELAPEISGDAALPEHEFSEAYAEARRLWLEQSQSIRAELAAARLNRRSYPLDQLDSRATGLDTYFAAPQPGLTLPDKFETFCAGKLAKSATGGSAPPQHAFFNAAEALWRSQDTLTGALDARLRRFCLDFLRECRADIARRKRKQAVQSYDDLLLDLAAALSGPGGESLAARLRSRYRAALIDEFQDTDAVQYGIFARLYGAGGLPVFLVGDPKQAIYSFRGADVFAYLTARNDASAGHSLLHNRRSDPALVTAVNALFERPQAFVLDQLEFAPAIAATAEHTPCHIDDSAAPLTLWQMTKPAEAKSFTKESAARLVAQAVAGDISRLLRLAQAGQAQLGERVLEGGDIAVLVRKHRQGEAVRSALLALGIASVTLGAGSVWKTPEALELERLLLAIAAPAREGLVRAALATSLLGADGSDLERWNEDDAGWSERLQTFHEYHTLCRERGFAPMWQMLCARERVAPRLLAHPDGARRLTNLRHLAELLQAAEHDERLNAEGLARHLARARNGASEDADAAQLRLESDEHLVKIVTIHAAKGLEYPVVYCPFLWDAPSERKGNWPVACHSQDSLALADTGSPHPYPSPQRGEGIVLPSPLWGLPLFLTSEARLELGVQSEGLGMRGSNLHHQAFQSHSTLLDFGSPTFNAHHDAAIREELAESLRLAYVALTRAKHRCILAWGEVNGAERSALGWLLPDAASLATLEQRTDGAIRIEDLPTGKGKPFIPSATPAQPLQARAFSGRISRAWRINSFSSLAARLDSAASELPDHDPLPDATLRASAKRGDAERSLFDFPRGTKAGSCLHALLERVDFANHAAPSDTMLAATLREFGFEAEWQPVLRRMLADVLATPLDASGLRLADIPRAQRLDEMEFTFPVDAADTAALGKLLGGSVPPGFMKGFIDLVFQHEGRWHLADYKSNWLGDNFADYAPERLDEAMRQHRYDLQALIYTVALHRALALREPGYAYERDFGGVWYLFLRGMHPQHGPRYGVHYLRPPLALIKRLDAALAAKQRWFA